MYLEPGGIFGSEAGAVAIAAKHINRQLVVFLIVVAEFVTVMWKYSWAVIGAAAAANTYRLAFLATQSIQVRQIISNLPLGMMKLTPLQ